MVQLFMILAGRFDIYGIVHGLNRFGSSWLKLTSWKVKGFFVLNDHLVERSRHLNFRIQSMYPVFFPQFPEREVSKPEGKLWICIPGQLEYKRRNYLGLLDELATGDLNEDVQFILLGRSSHRHGDGADFRSRIEDRKDRFMLFDSFIPDDLFHSIVKKCDLVMPLMGGKARYSTEAITGSVNLAFAYKIPLIMEEEFMEIEDFKRCGIDYSKGTLVTILNKLNNDQEAIRKIRRNIINCEKFDFNFQRERFIRFLEA